MAISAIVIADSTNKQGGRLTTVQARYPEIIHNELLTHRAFSRNASSSRAIPVERLIQDVLDDPFIPNSWPINRPGMTAVEVAGEKLARGSKALWLKARNDAVDTARTLSMAGVHKQIANRLLQPWKHINVVISSTEWENFFALRCHADAQPEMQELAFAIRSARAASVPKLLHPGEWHTPYVPADKLQSASVDWAFVIKLSVARCARVSYLTHEGKPSNVDDDLRLHDRLVGAVPLHASPAEHQATPDVVTSTGSGDRWHDEDMRGNFEPGWVQYRKILEANLR